MKVVNKENFDLKGKKILVIGMGKSGQSAVRFLADAGAAKIIASDHKQELADGLSWLKELPGVEVSLGVQTSELAEGIDLVLKSPGVPPGLLPLKKAREQGILVLTEVELAYHYIGSPIIGITGTNGKTTTTMLLGEMLRAGWKNSVFVAGNIGTPLLEIAEEVNAADLVVAELSSFQLEGTYNFHPWISILLNITPDHLDYHGSMQEYIDSKSKILSRQLPGEIAVLNNDDVLAAALAGLTKAEVWKFSRRFSPKGDIKVGLVNNIVTAVINGVLTPLLPCSEIKIPGGHNLDNAMAATAAAIAAGIEPGIIIRVLREFPGVEHRLELVEKISGAAYINDSKGTNPDSTIKALEAFPGPLILMAGGYDKGSDFNSLTELFPGHVKHLILLGETRNKLAESAKSTGFTEITMVANLEEAVQTANKLALPGDTVLFSPACASWDMFDNYEERGRKFKELVLRLGREKGDEKR